MKDNTVIKFLPCNMTVTSDIEEWLDALSMEGYLLTYESINTIYAKFQKTDNLKRYYHLVIPTIHTRSMGFINDEDQEITSQTIMQYKESGMQYMGEAGGCLIFRTDQLDVVKKCCEENGYFDVKKLLIQKIILWVLPLIAVGVSLHALDTASFSIRMIQYITFLLMIIADAADMIRVIRQIRNQSTCPTYLKDVKVRSSVFEMILLACAVLVLVLVLVLLVIKQ